MTRLIPLGVAALLVCWALSLSIAGTILGALAGAIAAGVIEGALRDWAASLSPATKAERRLAAKVESAVRQRSLTMDRSTGEHAAQSSGQNTGMQIGF